MATKNYIGIDLGTTESTVSVIEIEKFSDDPIEKLRPLSIFQYDENHIPDTNSKGLQSSIYIIRDKNEIYTGGYAKYIYSKGDRPLQTIRSVKTRIGGESAIDIPKLDDEDDIESFDMTQLSAMLLRTIYLSIQKQIKGDIEQVTVTIPAGFNSDERRATIDATVLAGFKNVNLLDEPTAVLLNFLNSDTFDLDFGDEYFKTSKNILVYDIGGGTLDISIAKVSDKDGDFEIDLLGRSERMDFGGDNIDKYIASCFLEDFEVNNDPLSERDPEEQAKIVSRIVSWAEKYKIRLSQRISNTESEKQKKRVREEVNFEIINGLKIRDIILNDDKLRDILAPILSEKGKLLEPLIRTIRFAKLKKTDIDMVVITGGSGKFYLVEEVLRKYFGNSVEFVEFTEMEAVSKGAAIHSYNMEEDELRKIDIQDIMSDSIFIKTENGFNELIPNDTPPNSKGQYKYIFSNFTKYLSVFLYYGVDGDTPDKYREIAGTFKELDSFQEQGDKVDIEWELTQDKIVKIYFNGKELVSTAKQSTLSNFLQGYKINDFNN